MCLLLVYNVTGAGVGDRPGHEHSERHPGSSRAQTGSLRHQPGAR